METAIQKPTHKHIVLVKWNDNDLKSIESAEQHKQNLEHLGYELKNTFVNSITGDNSFQYVLFT